MILLLFIFLGGFFIIYSFFYFVVTRFHGDTLFKSIILLSRSRSNFFYHYSVQEIAVDG